MSDGMCAMRCDGMRCAYSAVQCTHDEHGQGSVSLSVLQKVKLRVA